MDTILDSCLSWLFIYLPVPRVKRLITAIHITFIRLHFGVDADVDLQAVGCEERLIAALLRALEAVITCEPYI